MYGLLLENLAAFVKIQWGESKWDSVRRHAGIDAPSFSVHHVYAETLIPRLARSACEVLDVEQQEFFEAMGVYFVEFVGQYGYDQVLSVLGRHMRDFLNGLDNLHEYLKFSYPKMRAPSFYCENETADGLTLHYRSKRRGFVFYTMGQIKQVAKHFYNMDCDIQLVSEELDGDTMHVIMQLSFDNRAFGDDKLIKAVKREEQQLPVLASMIFDVFPFCVVFCPKMTIRHTGHSLINILKDLCGQCITQAFDMLRPLIPFTFNSILERSNNIFELMTTAPIKDDDPLDMIEDGDTSAHLRLKGQMLFMEQWNMILFLATPVTPDLEGLQCTGLYINDLSLHDCSRDLVLAGTQQSVELKLALDQEQQKSKKLEESMKKLDEEMKVTDELLYQMIPKQVADRIRRGENPVDTCEVYDSVSILFSDVVTFTEICSRINPMQVVSMLNHMYSLFDQLTERNGVYKVETIGDAYMVVGGAPVADENHCERICDMALDMIDASKGIKDPSQVEHHIKLRVGVHSGTVVAGVVGLKMPRWCLFGDCVNTASRLESTSEAGRVQISEQTRDLLPGTYIHEYRGTVPMKGKGDVGTYWLTGRKERVALSELQCNSFSWAAPVINIKEGKMVAEVGSTTPLPRSSSYNNNRRDSIDTASVGDAASVTGSVAGSLARSTRSRNSIPDLFRNEGHLPMMHHQVSIEDMNLSAAKRTCANIMKKRGSEKKTSGDQTPKTPTKTTVVSFEEPIATMKESKSDTQVAKPSEADSSTDDSSSIKRSASMPTSSLKEAVAMVKSLNKAAAAAAAAGNVGEKASEPSKPITELQKSGVEGALNQTQENTVKSQISNGVVNNNPNSNPSNNIPINNGPVTVNPGTGAGTESNANNNSNSNNTYGNKPRDPLAKRLRENKVALLTSEAMAQLGCSGFRTRQKEVVSQTCSLI